MTRELCFWILMLLWLVFGLVQFWPKPNQPVNFPIMGGTLLLFILLLLLGWQTFGPPIK